MFYLLRKNCLNLIKYFAQTPIEPFVPHKLTQRQVVLLNVGLGSDGWEVVEMIMPTGWLPDDVLRLL